VLTLGYYSDITQREPTDAIRFGKLAEEAGFDAVWTSDHFHPWVHTNAKCGFAWVWLGSFGASTRKVMFGTGITAPIIRYNPAIVAQAFATLGNMYPSRPFIAVGTGEAMNELPVGMKWPHFRERAERLEEAVKIMKMLWSEEFVSFRGKYYSLKKANLYTKPKKPVPLYIAANGPTVAELAGKYADGLLTLPFPDEHYRNVLFPAVAKGARASGRDPSEIEKLVELQVSYDKDYDKALEATKWWAPTVLPVFFKVPISDPREIESHGALVSEDGLKTGWFISDSIDAHIKNIERYIKLGFTNIHLQSSSWDDSNFISEFGSKVLPYLKEAYGKE
jgi:coenzyme F420-dependent glucose-6-phosphate dehydrogenase